MSEVWSLSALNITNCRPVGLPYSDKSYTKLAEMKTWWWSVASLVFLSQPAVNNGKYLIREGGGGAGVVWPDSRQSSQCEKCCEMRRSSSGSVSQLSVILIQPGSGSDYTVKPYTYIN